MNKHKRMTLLACAFLTSLSIAACGKAKDDEFAADQQEIDMQTSEDADPETAAEEIDVQTSGNTDSETTAAETDVQASKNTGPETTAEETDVQTSEDTDPEMTAEEMLDLFLNGSINAVYSTDPTSAFYINDLKMDSEEWDSYSIGEKVDLDNDGEDELIICGPYGGRYLDARDNTVYEFAAGGGTAMVLSYTYYNGSVWVMYSNRMSAGYEAYHMEKFEGADNLVAEINFGEELVDQNDKESGMKYTWNGTEISYDEYTAFCSKIFAAEVSTN